MGCAWNDPAGYSIASARWRSQLPGTPSARSPSRSGMPPTSTQVAVGPDDVARPFVWAVRLSPRSSSIATAIAGASLSLFVFQLIQSVLRREPTGLARGSGDLRSPSSGVGWRSRSSTCSSARPMRSRAGVVKATTGSTLAHLGGIVLGRGALTASVHGSAALLLLSLACIGATVVVYGAVVVRKVLIVVTAVFAPVALAGSLADITVSWTRRWIEATIALISSKLVLVLVFVSGYGILLGGGQSSSGPSKGVTRVISGIVVLFVAGFAPWMTLKIVHFTGERAHQLHSAATTPVAVAAGGRAAQRAAPYVMHLPVTAAEAVVGTGPAAAGTVGTSAGALAAAGAAGPPAVGTVAAVGVTARAAAGAGAAAAGRVDAVGGSARAAAGPAGDSVLVAASVPDFAGQPKVDHTSGVGHARPLPVVSGVEGAVESAPAARAARTASASSSTGRSR